MDAQPQEIIMEDIKAVRKETTLEKHIQTVMLAVITFAMVGGFTKINSINESLIRLEEREKVKSEIFLAMQNTMNRMQIDIVDLKERVTRFENKK